MDISKKLKETLPKYAIPNYFFDMEHIYITKNGKLDINVLERKTKNILLEKEVE